MAVAFPFACYFQIYESFPLSGQLLSNQPVDVDRVDERGLVKVADFGLSRELIVQDYYRLCHSKTPVPVRWMAPESLSANVFTTMSDVVRLPMLFDCFQPFLMKIVTWVRKIYST